MESFLGLFACTISKSTGFSSQLVFNAFTKIVVSLLSYICIYMTMSILGHAVFGYKVLCSSFCFQYVHSKHSEQNHLI